MTPISPHSRASKVLVNEGFYVRACSDPMALSGCFMTEAHRDRLRLPLFPSNAFSSYNIIPLICLWT